jgi:hypothetical protein
MFDEGEESVQEEEDEAEKREATAHSIAQEEGEVEKREIGVAWSKGKVSLRWEGHEE